MENIHDEDIAEFNEAVQLMKSDKLEAAIERFRSAATKGVDRPMEHYALAVALYKNNQWTEARSELQRFLEMSPDENRYVQQARAMLPVLNEKIDEQEKLKKKSDLSANADYNEALNAYMRGDAKTALQLFEKTLEQFPDNKHVFNNMGLTHLSMKNHRLAIACFQKAIEADPVFLQARSNLGLAWLEYGNVKAKETFEAIVQEDSRFFDGLVNLASLCYREGDIARARQLWQQAYAIRPDDAQVRKNLGIKS